MAITDPIYRTDGRCSQPCCSAAARWFRHAPGTEHERPATMNLRATLVVAAFLPLLAGDGLRDRAGADRRPDDPARPGVGHRLLHGRTRRLSGGGDARLGRRRRPVRFEAVLAPGQTMHPLEPARGGRGAGDGRDRPRRATSSSCASLPSSTRPHDLRRQLLREQGGAGHVLQPDRHHLGAPSMST